MTPMIDVVFLLLVFFLWTASFYMAEQILPSRVSALSGSATVVTDQPPPEADFDDVVIRVLWDGDGPAWLVNEQPMRDLAAVRSTLQAIADVRPDAPVILHPDGDVPLGHVIDLYDAARLEGFDQVQFAASEAI
jgi:biopolymer transport protein ExbD